MKKQLIISVSAAFQAFALKTCAENVGPAKSKEEGKNLTQSELSDAILALVTGPQLYVETLETDPETGEESEMFQPVSLQDYIAEVLNSRDMTSATREGAKAKLTAAEAKLEANARALEACKKQLADMGKTPEEITAFLTAAGFAV